MQLEEGVLRSGAVPRPGVASRERGHRGPERGKLAVSVCCRAVSVVGLAFFVVSVVVATAPVAALVPHQTIGHCRSG